MVSVASSPMVRKSKIAPEESILVNKIPRKNAMLNQYSGKNRPIIKAISSFHLRHRIKNLKSPTQQP